MGGRSEAGRSKGRRERRKEGRERIKGKKMKAKALKGGECVKCKRQGAQPSRLRHTAKPASGRANTTTTALDTSTSPSRTPWRKDLLT